MPTKDERDGEPQPGDLVIELRKGTPVVYTQPESADSAPQGEDLGDEDD